MEKKEEKAVGENKAMNRWLGAVAHGVNRFKVIPIVCSSSIIMTHTEYRILSLYICALLKLD